MAETLHPLKVDATQAEIVNFLTDLHACVDRNHASNTERLKGLRFDGRVSIGAAAAIIVSLGGMVWGATNWLSTTNEKLDSISQLIAAGRARDARLDRIDAELQDLKDVTDQNNRTLRGVDRLANPRGRRP